MKEKKHQTNAPHVNTHRATTNSQQRITRGDIIENNQSFDAELDCVGFYCPMPIAMTKEEIEKIEIGQVLKVEADDPAAEEDIKRWAKRTGHQILKFQKEGSLMTFYIKRMK